MAILLSLAYGKKVNLKDIYVEGITKISSEDIAFAKELGYRIKLLAIGMLKGDEVEGENPSDHDILRAPAGQC